MTIFAAGVASALMLLAGVGLLIYFLMRKAQLEKQDERRSRIVNDLPSLPRHKPTWQTSDNAVDMAEIARDLNAQLTTKMIVLEQLLADSEKQIAKLEELLARIEAARTDS